jgi:RNA polymerase sigma-70 factor (ECF subfamily)
MRRGVHRTGNVQTVTGADHEALQEHRLVAAAKAGDRAALGKLLSLHGPRLYRSVLLPRLGHEARARDALSATYERVIQRLDHYEWQPCGIYPWLRVVAMRIALDMLRASKRELLFEGDAIEREVQKAEAALDHAPAGSDPLQERHDREVARMRVHDALDRINPRYAQAIRLRVLEERPREEVAERMGVTPATFDVILHRSVAALKRVLQPGHARGASE